MEELKLQDLTGKKILIVEDDDISLKLLTSFFEGSNAEIFVADDGDKAIDIFSENNDIDLVLMDIMLPNLDGITATEKIKEIKKEVPVIAQTAYTLIKDINKCKLAGCDDYIRKPIDLDELIIKISKYL